MSAFILLATLTPSVDIECVHRYRYPVLRPPQNLFLFLFFVSLHLRASEPQFGQPKSLCKGKLATNFGGAEHLPPSIVSLVQNAVIPTHAPTIKDDASQKKLKEGLYAHFKNAVRVYKTKLAIDPFRASVSHSEIALQLGLSLIKNSVFDSAILMQLDVENIEGLLQRSYQEQISNGHEIFLLETHSNNGSNVLRVIIGSHPQNNMMYVRLELRSPTPSSNKIVQASDVKESITLDIFRKKDQWMGIVSHTHVKAKRSEKSTLALNKDEFTKDALLSEIETPKLFEIKSEQDERDAIDFLLELTKITSVNSREFNTVVLIPPLPKDESKAQIQKNFLDHNGAFSHQIRFQSPKALRALVKKYIKSDPALGSEGIDPKLLDSLMGRIEDGLPTLLFFSSQKRFILSPKHLSNNVPHEPAVSTLFYGSCVDLAEHGRIARSIHNNNNDAFQLKALETQIEKIVEQLASASDSEAAHIIETPAAALDPSFVEPTHESNPENNSSILEDKLSTTLSALEAQKKQNEDLRKQLEEQQATLDSRAEDLALDILGSEIAAQNTRIEELEAQLKLSRSAEFSLRQQIIAQERSGSLTEAEIQKLRSIETQGMRSVPNAIELALALHPNSFALTPQASKQIKTLSIAETKDVYLAQEIYTSLTGLWHIFWKQGAPQNIVSKEQQFKQLTGLDIAFDESSVTKEKLRAQNERSFEFEGEHFMAWPHVKLSQNRRIYFAVDDKNRRVLIHSWPKHLWTSHDGALK